ncbi:MAG: hypothetical protein ACLQT7_02340 [Candidatus Dormibacteria bacterium]
MSYDTLGMIRRGWQEVAATVAPQVSGLAELLDHRLAEATRLGRLDEANLLSIVDAATQLAANSGAVEVAPALSKRLRRHVYEYLLSLDAAADAGTSRPAGQTESPDGRGMLIGAEEVAALRRGQSLDPGAAAPEPDGDRVRWFDPSAVLSAEGEGGRLAAQPRAPTPPQFSFHIGDPDDLSSNHGPHESAAAPGAGAGGGDYFEGEGAPTAGGGGSGPRRASFADPSTWPKPAPPALRGVRDLPAVDPGLGDAAPPTNGSPFALADGAQFQDVGSWPPVRPLDGVPRGGFEDAGRWSSRWPGAEAPPLTLPDGADPGAAADPGIAEFGPAELQPHPDLRESWRDASAGWLAGPDTAVAGYGPTEAQPAWSVRQPEAVELHRTALAGGFGELPAAPLVDVPESDVVALRAAVNEKLRKKRCDDAAAVLQQAAQELGGEAVAELALDAGDRCRTLGKRNAALNCYLAASRADPVYEPPLARLADICIDDQDIDLAVSYLERIARLTRLRGDTRGALRIYRKIATIAPYRDDVLEMLMRAQATGRIDP